jgi:hypothetical protein
VSSAQQRVRQMRSDESSPASDQDVSAHASCSSLKLRVVRPS